MIDHYTIKTYPESSNDEISTQIIIQSSHQESKQKMQLKIDKYSHLSHDSILKQLETSFKHAIVDP